MNLKLRLNLIITILLLIVMMIGATHTIRNARKNIQAEISSTAVLALHMLDAEIVQIASNMGSFSTANVMHGSFFRLGNLSDVRHLKIEFFNVKGELKDSNRMRDSAAKNVPPLWFSQAMDSVTTEMPITRRQVYQNENVIGELVVTPDPSYEIAEVWADTKGMLGLMSLFFIVVNLLVYWAVSRGLRPIDNVISALTELEMGNFSSRLPVFALPELTSISSKFNVMAETLQESVEHNRHLTQRMISLQEDERKNLAQELHDEIGQHLTAIHIDAAAIAKAKNVAMVKESADAIDGVVRQMMDIVHSILQRLRPSGLDELGLEAVLQELIDGWQQRHNEVRVTRDLSGNFNSVSEQVVITVYRLVQECLTNIARYAEAGSVDVIVHRQADQISLSVTDNGLGFNQAIKPKGFGLMGMRERVEGLAGTFEIKTARGKGTQVRVVLPCDVKEPK